MQYELVIPGALSARSDALVQHEGRVKVARMGRKESG